MRAGGGGKVKFALGQADVFRYLRNHCFQWCSKHISLNAEKWKGNCINIPPHCSGRFRIACPSSTNYSFDHTIGCMKLPAWEVSSVLLRSSPVEHVTNSSMNSTKKLSPKSCTLLLLMAQKRSERPPLKKTNRQQRWGPPPRPTSTFTLWCPRWTLFLQFCCQHIEKSGFCMKNLYVLKFRVFSAKYRSVCKSYLCISSP